MSKIKEFRLQNDFTQRYIAYKIGVTQQAVAKWENGTSVPNITLIIMPSELMHCSALELASTFV